MDEPIITSRANPLVKELRALSQKKFREQRGEFLVQGIQPVLEAIQSNASIRMLVVASELLTSKPARGAVRQQERAGTRIVHVSREVFESISEREHPTGIAAVVKSASHTLNDLRVDESAIFVALHQVSNPGNLGTILRTADAVNARGVILIGNATDPYAPIALNASRGAVFTVPLVQVENANDVLNWCRENRIRLVTTSDQAAQDLWNADLSPPLMLFFGNEGEGLPPHILAQGQAVKIPMHGAVDSLNLAVAAGVLLYEYARRSTAINHGQ
jgi:RNA methyltransferase, TrmH family